MIMKRKRMVTRILPVEKWRSGSIKISEAHEESLFRNDVEDNPDEGRRFIDGNGYPFLCLIGC